MIIQGKLNNRVPNTTFTVNSFEKLRDNTDAYFIGYLLGDGIYHHSTNKRKARLGLSSSEEYIINFFRDNYSPDQTIQKSWPVNKKLPIKATKYSWIITFSSKFEKCFKKFGLLDIKKRRTYSNIGHKYMPAFLRGLIDADGNISYGIRKDRKRLWANIRITHSNFDMLSKLQNFLQNELSISSSLKHRKTEECSNLTISSLENCYKLLLYLNVDLKCFNKIKDQRMKNLCHLIGLKLESPPGQSVTTLGKSEMYQEGSETSQ